MCGHLFIVVAIIAGGCAIKENSLTSSNRDDETPKSKTFDYFNDKAVPMASDERSGDSISTASKFYLTDKEFGEVSSVAQRGDSSAAFRLAQYFTFSAPHLDKDERKKMARYWLEMAANNGSSTAAYNLAFEYFHLDKNFAVARKWALVSIANGGDKAKSLLKMIVSKEGK